MRLLGAVPLARPLTLNLANSPFTQELSEAGSGGPPHARRRARRGQERTGVWLVALKQPPGTHPPTRIDQLPPYVTENGPLTMDKSQTFAAYMHM
jgi:hypothetical protein